MNAHGELRAPDSEWGAPAVKALTWIAALGALGFLLGLWRAPQAAWTGYLIGFHVLLALALAGPVGLAFLHLSGARWSVPLESVPRAMYRALPAAALAGLVLLAGVPTLFEWSHADVVAADPVLTEKSAYLNFTAFAARLVVFFALWLWLGRRVVQASAARSAADPAAGNTHRLRTAAVFLLAFAPTWSLASVDWLMSLEPHWFSSIYALLTVGGLALSGLAAATILIAALDRRDRVGAARYGDLGALLLSLAIFWGYIWYCQYMLVWYTNMPEETTWYAARLTGNWGVLTKLTCVVLSAAPLALLMFRPLRRGRKALIRVSGLILGGQIVNMYVLAGPPLIGKEPLVTVWHAAPVAGLVALFFLLTLRALRRESRAALQSAAAVRSSAATPAAPKGPELQAT